MLTLRLDTELENKINNTANIMNISKSELIRKSVNTFIKNIEQPTPWELGKNIFGKYSSDKNNNAENRKVLIKEKILAKNDHQ